MSYHETVPPTRNLPCFGCALEIETTFSNASRPPGSGARHRRGFRGRSPSRRRFSSSVERSGPARACELAGPTQFRYGAVFLPQAVFEKKYVIAYCAWEIERVPDQWLEGLELVDEIWVCSEFVSRTADKKNPTTCGEIDRQNRSREILPRNKSRDWHISQWMCLEYHSFSRVFG